MTTDSDKSHELQHLINRQTVNHLMQEVEEGLTPKEIVEIRRDHSDWVNYVTKQKNTNDRAI
jgi:hypothetical protein